MRWGLIAYGRIAKKFKASIDTIKEASVSAIASRSNYSELKTQFDSISIYQNYDELYADPNVDIVYISTTHNYHKENVIKALKAGKHVLCEKPLGIHPDEVKEMLACANQQQLFLMEAMWTRFLPAYTYMKACIANNKLGAIKLIKGDFSFDGRDFDSNTRVKNPALAAGAIWDVGIYPISMAVDIYDCQPTQVIASGFLDQNKVDVRSSLILNFGQSRQALIHSGIDLSTIHSGEIIGESQWIHMPEFWHGDTVRIGDWQNNQQYIFPVDLPTSFSYEIKACYEAINQGLIQHPKMSHEHSLIISEIMEDALQQLRTAHKT